MRRFLARVIVPPEGSSCPMMIRRRVVLPMPLGPTSASRAPFATEKVTPAKRSSAPKDLEREFTVIRDIMTDVRQRSYRLQGFNEFWSSSANLDGLYSMYGRILSH